MKIITFCLLCFLLFSIFLNAQSNKPGILKINHFIVNFESDNHQNSSKSLLEKDLAKLDSIYSFSLKTFENDHSETFLALTFATVPFSAMKLETSFFHNQFEIPLPFIQIHGFSKKVKNLPKHLFYDSPKSDFGDKDKIAHFFGNAFLSNNLGSFISPKIIGIYLEYFEDSFRVDGGFSQRDLRANLLGEIFGKLVVKYEKLMPSVIFMLFNSYFSTTFTIGIGK